LFTPHADVVTVKFKVGLFWTASFFDSPLLNLGLLPLSEFLLPTKQFFKISPSKIKCFNFEKDFDSENA